MAKMSESELVEMQRQLKADKNRLIKERRQMHEQWSQIARESQEIAKLKEQHRVTVPDSNVSHSSSTAMPQGPMGTIGCIREFSLKDDFEL